MQLLLISKANKSLSLKPGPVLLGGGLLLGIGAALLVFYAGGLYSLSMSRASLKNLYSEAAPVWDSEIELQRQLLQQARDDAEKNLDVLALRLSKLQAHVLRLDALGARLADMANLSDIEFDMTVPPGLGGPRPEPAGGTIEVKDFIQNLEALGRQLQDRSEKLAALEAMLMDRSLQSRTTPAGRPVRSGWVSSLFGMRADPFTGKPEFHYGVDYAGRAGSPVLALGAGIVTWAGARQGYGKMVEISHGNGYSTRYAHNQKNTVVIGQKVDKGQQVALMGATGRATGPHVHLEVLHDGKIVNPSKYISIK